MTGALGSIGALGNATADRALLEEVLSETGVAREMAEVGWSSYPYHLLRKVGEAFIGFVVGGVSQLFAAEGIWRVAVWLLLVLAAAALFGWLVRAVLGWWRQRKDAGTAGDESDVVTAGGVASREHLARSAAAWRSELEAHLRAGRIPQALEAAWWWLARSLAAERADSSWTSRELVARAGRGELGPIVGTLDALMYGPRRPRASEVRGLVQALDERLAPAAPTSAPRAAPGARAS